MYNGSFINDVMQFLTFLTPRHAFLLLRFCCHKNLDPPPLRPWRHLWTTPNEQWVVPWRSFNPSLTKVKLSFVFVIIFVKPWNWIIDHPFYFFLGEKVVENTHVRRSVDHLNLKWTQTWKKRFFVFFGNII